MIAGLKRVGQRKWQEFLYWYRLSRARQRLKLGYCPLCNSDAPGIDTCTVCYGNRGYFHTKGAQRQHIGLLWYGRYQRQLDITQYWETKA